MEQNLSHILERQTEQGLIPTGSVSSVPLFHCYAWNRGSQEPLMKGAAYWKDTQEFWGISKNSNRHGSGFLGSVIGSMAAINLHWLILLLFYTRCQPHLGLSHSLLLCSAHLLLGYIDYRKAVEGSWSTSRLWSPKAQVYMPALLLISCVTAKIFINFSVS